MSNIGSGRCGRIAQLFVEPKINRPKAEWLRKSRDDSVGETRDVGELATAHHTIVELARKHKMYVHIDGARLTNSVVHLKTTFKKMITDLGIDLVSFGGTKNGLAFGEAVLILNNDLQKDFKYLRKQSAQLPSKTRFIASQFIGYFEHDLCFQIAQHTLEMSQLLRSELEKIQQIEITQSTQSNAVFAKIPKKLISVLREKYFFYVWDERSFECRLMMSWDTTPEDIQGFIQLIQTTLN